MSIEGQIAQVKKQLNQMDGFRPGSVSQQYNVCGKKECRCKDKKNPQKHGPYYILSYRFDGKNRTEYVNPQYLQMLEARLKNYEAFQQLIQKWVGLEIEKSRQEMTRLSKPRKR
jgi:hypothetical protein